MNWNRFFAIAALVIFIAILLFGVFFPNRKRGANWLKALSWNIRGLADALRKIRLK